MLKLYPDHAPARLGRLLTDFLVLAWAFAWALAGRAVFTTIEALQQVADGLTATGRTFNSWIGTFRDAVPHGVPVLSSFLQQTADALQRSSGDQLLGLGAQARTDVDAAALALGLATALPPILIVGGVYLWWRYRDAREMGAALAFVRSAERSGRLEQAKAVLAYRAVASLSFRDVMAASADPIGDLAARRYDPLAAAMLRRAGLESFRLHDPGPPALPEGPH